MKKLYVYILCNKRNGTLYTGVTSDLIKRVYEHKNGLVDGFTKKYNIHCLVWYETYESAGAAINGEKQIKKWKRAWKLELLSFVKVMERRTAYIYPLTLPSPPIGGEDKGEGADVKPMIVPLFMRTSIIEKHNPQWNDLYESICG